MTLLDTLLGRSSGRRIQRLAIELSRQLEPRATSLVLPAIERMSFPESRGYIGAKLGSLIAQNAELMLRNSGLAGADCQRRLTALTTESLAQSIIAGTIRHRAMRPSLRPAA
jgi:hypothetical protein